MNHISLLIMRAVLGLVLALVIVRFFFGRIYPVGILGLAILMVGLAYFAEYLRHRKNR